MAKAKMVVPEPVATEVKLSLTLAEANWLYSVVSHVNSCSRESAHDANIWNALSEAGINLSDNDRREILRTYDTDYGVFQGETY